MKNSRLASANHKFSYIKDFKAFQESYQVIQDIGCGNFGTVKLVLWKQHDIECAVKIVTKARLQASDSYENMKHELEALMTSDQCNITSIIQLLEDDKQVYIVMEYIPEGDVDHFFAKQDFNFSGVVVCHIIKQLVTCLKYLHEELGIVHRDIKPANVLIEKERLDEEKMDIKLTDFGFAGQCQDSRVSMQQNIGTPEYMAPELWDSRYIDEQGKKVGKNVDIWAIGVMTFKLLSMNSSPFQQLGEENVDPSELKRRICEDEPYWENFCGNDAAKKFVAKCLTKDWTRRVNST